MSFDTRARCAPSDHQSLCPSFGGTPPPFPEAVPGADDPLPHQRRAVEAQQAAGGSSPDPRP